jgi:uncharacterized membrane protein YeiH
MDFAASTLVGVLDRVGLAVFAFAGVEVGVRRRLDVFGLLVMGVVTAAGGGLMRDVILGRLPLVLDRPDYLAYALGGSAVAIAAAWTRRQVPQRAVALAGALGLGAFAAAGALAGVHANLWFPAVVVLAIVTATGGGVLRDLMANRIPLVLRTEVNATAAALGGTVLWAVEPWSAGAGALACVAVTAGLCILALSLGLHLPGPGGQVERSQE